MNGTTMPSVARSVQLAVMASSSTTLADAVAEARRPHEATGAHRVPVRSLRVASAAA